LRAKIVDDEEDAAERIEAERIENTVKAADDVRRDSALFPLRVGRNPKGWHDFSPISASRS
jgi:hypothetical protein